MKKGWIALGWLIVWEVAARFVANDVLLVGPVSTLRTLARLATQASFWQTVGFSYGRIFGGFLIGALLGCALAVVAFLVPVVGDILSPFVSALKAVPVACFVVMLLIWAGTGMVALIVTALVVFPLLYFNTSQGLQSADRELLEIASVFTMTASDKIKHIYLPPLYRFLYGALQVAIGMSWKSGVAAEVIAQRAGTLGNELYRAKVLLETDRLFAVTLTVIVLSFATEKAILAAMRGAAKRWQY